MGSKFFQIPAISRTIVGTGAQTGFIILLLLATFVSPFPFYDETCNDCDNEPMKEFLQNQLERAKKEIKKSVMGLQDMQNNRYRKEPSVFFNMSFNKILEFDAASEELKEIYYKGVMFIDGKILKFENALERGRINESMGENLNLPTDYVFSKIFQWLNITFYVLGVNSGEAFLYIMTPDPSLSISQSFSLKQRIRHPLTNRYAVGGEFFIYDNNLYLFLLYDSPHQEIVNSIIYKWHNTYFDIDVQLVMTEEAVGISSFNYGSSVIISIIQSVSEDKDQKVLGIDIPAIFKATKKARSIVLKFSSKDKGVSHVEKINILPTMKPQGIIHFQFFEDDCILVCEKESPSTVYRWEGGEFLKWFEVPFMQGCKTVVPGYISDSTTLVFVSEHDKIVVYYVTYKDFVRFKIIPFPGEVIAYGVEETILSAFVKVQDSVIAVVLKLTLENPIVVHDLGRSSHDDPFEECFGSLEKELGKAHEKLLDISKKFSGLLFTDKAVVLPGIIQVTGPESGVTVSKGRITNLTSDYNSYSKMSFINNDLNELVDESAMLLQKGFMNKSDFIFKKDLYIDNLKLNSATARLINNYTVDVSRLISLSKDQYLNNIDVKSVSVNWLLVDELKSKHVNELVVNNGNTMEWNETVIVSELVCCNIVFNHEPLINGINLNNIVQKNKEVSILFGKKKFSRIEVDKVMTEYINGVPFRQWLNDNLKSTFNYEEQSEFHLTPNATVDDLNVKYIDGLDVNFLKNLFRNRINHDISGNLNFNKGFEAKTLKTTNIVSLDKGSLNGGFSKQRSTEGNGNLQGENNVKEKPKYIYENKLSIRGCLQVNEIIFVDSHLILGNKTVPINSLENEYWMNNTNQTIPEKVKFTNNVSVVGNLSSLNYINGINISGLLTTSHTKEINSSLSFKDVEIIGNVTTRSNQSDSELFDFEKFYKKFSSSEFFEDISDSLVFVNNTDGKLRYNARHNLNNSFKNQDSLTNKKVTIHGNLIVEGDIDMKIINNVNVSRITDDIHRIGNKTENFTFSNVTVKGINVKSLNGMQFSDVIHFNTDKAPKKIINKLLVKYNLSLVGMEVNKVNGIILNEVLPKVVTASQDIKVKGKKVFKSKIVIDNNLNADLINNFNITQVSSSFLSKSNPQNITGEYHLKNVSMDSLKTKSINSINPSSFVNVESSEEIFMKSDEIIFERLFINGDIITYDKSLKHCHLPKDHHPILLEDSEIKELVVNASDVHWHSHNNKGKLQNLFDDAVTLNDNQVITGSVIFKQDFIAGNVFTNESINDVNVTRVMSDGVQKNKKNQVIGGEKIFVQTINCVNASILKNAFIEVVSGVNITYLNKTVVRKNDDQIIKGRKSFKNGFTAHFLNIKGNINGLSTEKIFMTNSNKKLPHIKFENLEVMDNLQFETINGINLEEFLAQRVIIKDGKPHKQNVIQSDLVFNGSISLMGETFANSMNDIIIDDVLISNLSSKTTPTVRGCKTFTKPLTILGKLMVNLINGKNISSFYNSSVLADINGTISGNLEFNGNVFVAKSLRASSFRVNQKQLEFLNEANKTMLNFINSLLEDDHI